MREDTSLQTLFSIVIGSLFNKQNNMTTTEIIFDEKQEYETIKQIINSNFVNVKEYDSVSELKYISFDFGFVS